MTYDDILKHFGSQAAIARAIAIKQPSVCEWQNSGVPALRQIQLERITLGALRADPECWPQSPHPKQAAA